MSRPSLHLYTDSSPNGYKATIALEELALDYQLHHVRIEQGEHRTPEFLQLHPHGRIPVLVDQARDVTVFESAAILLYLAETQGRLMPLDHAGRWETMTWLIFHAASVGPVLGQRVHFEHFDQERYLPAIARYQQLSDAALATLDQRLAGRDWLAADQYTIADIANFGWLHIAEVIGMPFDHHRHLWAWYQRVVQRPAVQRGIALPEIATGP